MDKLNITHLVLSGGGMRGVIYIGAIRYLYIENLHKNISHIAANSIGSFVALCITFKLTIEEIEEIIYNSKDDKELCNIPTKNYYRIISKLGLSSISHFMEHLKRRLRIKYPDMDVGGDGRDAMSFKEVSQRFGVNLYFSTTNINRCENRIFSIEDTPDVSVFTACEASMAIPLLFTPIVIDGEHYYDGAFTNNFPIKIFAHISKENIIAMLLYKERAEYVPTKTKINIFYILQQICKMFEILRVNQVTINELNANDKDYYFMPKNINMKYSMNVVVNRKGVRLELSSEQIDEMILHGFSCMAEYIDKRKALLYEKNKLRLCDTAELLA
uniref:PNPLA domain-containing protein n=1 Tax=viral metagenome TaxID=1070528 RepID=A0A6C0LNM0_9ZZZZ